MKIFARRSLIFLTEATKEMFGGDATLSGDFGRVVGKGEADKLRKLLTEEVNESKGKILAGGAVKDTFVSPTIIDDVKETSVLLETPIKGPILPVVSFTSLEDAISILSRHAGHALYAFGSSIDTTYLAKELPNVTVYADDVPFEVLIGATLSGSSSSPSNPIRLSPTLFGTTTRIISSSSTPLFTVNLFAPFGPSKAFAIRKLIHSPNRLLINRVLHPPSLRRAFFPQGLFLVLGSVLTATVGLIGWGLWKFARLRL